MIIHLPRLPVFKPAISFFAFVLLAFPLLIFAQSDAERADNVRFDIEVDQQRLSELQQELQDQTELLEELAAERADLEAMLEETDEELSDLQPGSADASKMQLRRAELEQRIIQEKRKTDIVFEWAKGTRSEEKLIEENIEQLDELLIGLLGADKRPAKSGGARSDITTRSDVETGGQSEAAANDIKAPTSSTDVIGAMMPGGAATSAATSSPRNVSVSQTAEQIQARKEAEKAAQAALLAEYELDLFVDRKRLLQEQIVLEKGQLELDEQAAVVVGEGWQPSKRASRE